MDENYSVYEIIVVDDGSIDRTKDVVGFYKQAKYIAQAENMGKGAAVRRGIMEADGGIIVFSDADLSTPIYELKKVLEGLKEGYDIVIGSRALQNELVKKHQPWYRETMGKTFNKIVQLLVFSGIKDTQCGFKGFTKESAKAIFSKAKIDGFAFDVEALYLASRLGFKVKEVPVEWYNDERSTVHPIIDSIKMLLEIIKIRGLHKTVK
jgi:dolichyl-phosphate beta-glucosyltransferase